ncbi:hypothetical protein C1H46_024314 [Malus baccata]|uniref:Uncharacterized protein n=1 Tax=Malus baccata TaxID=106549 RepID=A0A540LUH3_MALBA|nr:hypothetical protein C1H46_024314 [Malus baccata]
MGPRVEQCCGGKGKAWREPPRTYGGSRPSVQLPDGRRGRAGLASGNGFVSSVGPIWSNTQI